MVVINSLERRTDQEAHDDDNEKRIELGERERKVEGRKCDRIFLSSAPITADMLPFKGLQGDQVGHPNHPSDEVDIDEHLTRL